MDEDRSPDAEIAEALVIGTELRQLQDAPQWPALVAAVEQAAIQASCETRRLVGQQAQAFTAAALPLCRPV